MLIDKLGTASFSNGVLRIACKQIGPDGQERDAGELLIPASQIQQVVAQFTTAVQRLESQLRARRDASAAAEATATE